MEEEFDEVMNINEDLVTGVLKRMKGGRAGDIFNFSSDRLMNGPELHYKHFQNPLIYNARTGQVAVILLLISFIQIVKSYWSEMFLVLVQGICV